MFSVDAHAVISRDERTDSQALVLMLRVFLRAEGPAYPLPVSKAPDYENFLDLGPKGRNTILMCRHLRGSIPNASKPGLVSPGRGYVGTSCLKAATKRMLRLRYANVINQTIKLYPMLERWKCTCFHLPPVLCHTRVSSEDLLVTAPLPESATCVTRT